MVKTGTLPKCSTLKRQRENAELELIIEEFGRSMRNANRVYIATPQCGCGQHGPQFTPGMEMAWNRYVEFCMKHPHE